MILHEHPFLKARYTQVVLVVYFLDEHHWQKVVKYTHILAQEQNYQKAVMIFPRFYHVVVVLSMETIKPTNILHVSENH